MDDSFSTYGDKTDYVSYQKPTGGMFLWLKLNKNIVGNWSSEEIFIKLASEGVITVPGQSFEVQNAFLQEKNHDTFIRLSFANALPDKLIESARTFANTIQALRKQA